MKACDDGTVKSVDTEHCLDQAHSTLWRCLWFII